jgi:hypothetical protein
MLHQSKGEFAAEQHPDVIASYLHARSMVCSEHFGAQWRNGVVGDLNDSKREGTITTYESQLKKYLVRNSVMACSTHV